MTVSISPIETGDDMVRAQDDFFREIVLSATADPFVDWENRANSMGDLLPGERFHLRDVEKNFDGVPLGRWIVFCEKPPCRFSPGRSRTITVMTIEPPGKPGVRGTPSDAHLDGLRMVVLDWREGRHAALERMERENEERIEGLRKDAMNEAHGRIDDVFWVWKRTMGENVNLRLGSDGKGPNHGGKHFGSAFQRDDAGGGIVLP
jgi:hypothetical protein